MCRALAGMTLEADILVTHPDRWVDWIQLSLGMMLKDAIGLRFVTNGACCRTFIEWLLTQSLSPRRAVGERENHFATMPVAAFPTAASRIA
jgi:hypothetical protein